MATSESFNEVLKRYMPYELLVEEMKKRNYFWKKVKKDSTWNGGTLEVPFEGAEASSLSMGSLTASNDVAEGEYVMGTLSTQPELWGTMKFHEKDLDRHGDLKKSYLKIAPQKINQFVTRMGERVALMLLGDGSIAKATGNGAIGGTITVDHPEYFDIGEKVVVDDDDSASASGYITAIDLNTKTLTIKDARSSGSAVDLSAYTTAQNAKIYLPGALTNGFTGLKSQLLSATNAGSASLFGQTKTAYPHLQALNIDGSGYTASTLLDDIFGGVYEIQALGKGNQAEVLMSYTNYKHIAKELEGQRRFTVDERETGYGFKKIKIMGVDDDVNITAIRGMADDWMPIVDWNALQFHGHKFFERKRHDGREYFLERSTSGYVYLVDIKFYGDLVVSKPSHMGAIHGISL